MNSARFDLERGDRTPDSMPARPQVSLDPEQVIARRALEMVAGHIIATEALLHDEWTRNAPGALVADLSSNHPIPFSSAAGATLQDRGTSAQAGRDERFETIGRQFIAYLKLTAERLSQIGVRDESHQLISEVVGNVRAYAGASAWHGEKFFLPGAETTLTGSWELMREKAYPPLFRALHELSGRPHTPGAFVAQYQLSDLTPLLRDEISTLLQSRVAQLQSDEPEEGIHWAVTPEEIAHYMSHDSTVLFTLHAGGELAGVFFLYTDFEPLSPGGRQICKDWCFAHGVEESRVAYGEIVALSSRMSEVFHRHGESGYRLLMESVDHACALFGIEHLLGEVRSGNPAMIKHRALKWEETTMRREHTPFPGVWLNLVHREVPSTIPLREFEGARDQLFANTLGAIIGNPAQIARARRVDGGAITNAAMAAEWAESYLTARGVRHLFRIVPYTGARALSGGREAISFQQDTGRQLTFDQQGDGIDQWSSTWWSEIRTFREYLAVMVDELLEGPH